MKYTILVKDIINNIEYTCPDPNCEDVADSLSEALVKASKIRNYVNTHHKKYMKTMVVVVEHLDGITWMRDAEITYAATKMTHKEVLK